MRALSSKLLRFASVGIANGIIYGFSTSMFASGFGIDAKIASVLGYFTAVPFAFFAHRSYTFGSQGAVKLELRRFVITQSTSLLVSVVAMAAAIDYFKLHYVIGIIAAVVLIPIVNFLALNIWVFSSPKSFDSDKK